MKIVCQILFMALFAQAAVAQDEKIKRITSFQYWSAFADRNGSPTCWAATRPLRSPGFVIHNLLIYVTNEGDFSIEDRGREIAKRGVAVLEVSGMQFPMTVAENAAFLDDRSQNNAVVQALASDWRARVVFDRGRHVAFSTQGFAKAFSAAAKACKD